MVARLTAMPYAEPPRCVLVASGAPNSAMMMHVTGMAILSARSTRSTLASPPDRSMRRDEPRDLVVAHVVRIRRLGHHLGRPLGEMLVARGGERDRERVARVADDAELAASQRPLASAWDYTTAVSAARCTSDRCGRIPSARSAACGCCPDVGSAARTPCTRGRFRRRTRSCSGWCRPAPCPPRSNSLRRAVRERHDFAEREIEPAGEDRAEQNRQDHPVEADPRRLCRRDLGVPRERADREDGREQHRRRQHHEHRVGNPVTVAERDVARRDVPVEILLRRDP